MWFRNDNNNNNDINNNNNNNNSSLERSNSLLSVFDEHDDDDDGATSTSTRATTPGAVEEDAAEVAKTFVGLDDDALLDHCGDKRSSSNPPFMPTVAHHEKEPALGWGLGLEEWDDEEEVEQPLNISFANGLWRSRSNSDEDDLNPNPISVHNGNSNNNDTVTAPPAPSLGRNFSIGLQGLLDVMLGRKSSSSSGDSDPPPAAEAGPAAAMTVRPDPQQQQQQQQRSPEPSGNMNQHNASLTQNAVRMGARTARTQQDMIATLNNNNNATKRNQLTTPQYPPPLFPRPSQQLQPPTKASRIPPRPEWMDFRPSRRRKQPSTGTAASVSAPPPKKPKRVKSRTEPKKTNKAIKTETLVPLAPVSKSAPVATTPPELIRSMDEWQQTFAEFLTAPSDHLQLATAALLPRSKMLIWGRQKLDAQPPSSPLVPPQVVSSSAAFLPQGNSWAPQTNHNQQEPANDGSNFMDLIRVDTEGRALHFHDAEVNFRMAAWITGTRAAYQKLKDERPPPCEEMETSHKYKKSSSKKNSKSGDNKNNNNKNCTSNVDRAVMEERYLFVKRHFRFNLLQMVGVDLDVPPEMTVVRKMRAAGRRSSPRSSPPRPWTPPEQEPEEAEEEEEAPDVNSNNTNESTTGDGLEELFANDESSGDQTE